ncbi:MAG TPA: hypothetical protein VK974_04840 [Methylophilaceae bacterium]|nr:hypothetical protein [Methylophilaceae bacterium]
MKSSNYTVIIPDTAQLIEAARMAVAEHLLLITNGSKTVLSPMMLPGYRRMSVSVKPQVAA